MKEVFSLGLEWSTQSVKAVILQMDPPGIVYTCTCNYDECFPKYKTIGGVLQSENPKERHTSPAMLLDAMDFILTKLHKEWGKLSQIAAIKADAQQHCTVYTNQLLSAQLRKLSPQLSLSVQLQACLSRQTSPIWEDRSTQREADALTQNLIPYGGISRLTGNKAELRFPAGQILHWASHDPVAYNKTDSIFLLSAFLTSVLCGKKSPVDTGDGWGTNLNNLNLHTPGFHPAVLQQMQKILVSKGCKENIKPKLGKMTHYDKPVGVIHSYFTKKYGINPKAILLAGTGDNPATLLGCGGAVVISLGSSYTINGKLEKIEGRENAEYNIFGYTPGNAMALTCFTNGAKLHDYFLKTYCNPNSGSITQETWEHYFKLAGPRNITADEGLLLPYLTEESVPKAAQGIIYKNSNTKDPASNIRALHLSQALSLKCHSSHIASCKELCVVGGASRNPVLLRWIADAFNTAVYTIQDPSYAAAIGCAISGARSILRCTYEQAAQLFVRKDSASVLQPETNNQTIWKKLQEDYSKLELEKH